jgi:predicted metal-dependent hydrolase
VRKSEPIKVVEFKEIGRVSFVRSYAARNLKITLRPFRGIQVTLPGFVSFDTADKFVQDKINWIKRQQEKMSRYEQTVTVFHEHTRFETRDHSLSLGTHAKSTIQATIRNGIIQINYPSFADIKDPRIQQVIRRAITAALKMEANKYLPEMIQRLALQTGLSYRQASVRNNKTRWGSCSADNRISLNLHLIRLPQHLCNYVMLHELCHTVHKHHQKSFWNLLDKLTHGKARELDRELNGYNPETF